MCLTVRVFQTKLLLDSDGNGSKLNERRHNMRCLMVLIVLLAGAALIFDTGCTRCGAKAGEKAAEKMIEAASGGRAKVDVGTVDISSLPANLRYPNAVVKGKWEVTTEEGKGINYMLESSDPKSKIVEFYKSALAGWKQSMVSETPDAITLAFISSDEKEAVFIILSSDAGKTAINLSHTKK